MQILDNTVDVSSGQSAPSIAQTQEDVLRAQIYRLLSGFLSAPPNSDDLRLVSSLVGDESDFGHAIDNFAKMAGKSNVSAADIEYHDLFIGVTRGELLPYGSYYQTGFLNEKPLAKLRRDMEQLGVERVTELKEPEDHISSVLEIMAGLIEGAYGKPLSLAGQKRFFNEHIETWGPHFFKDLEEAKYSVLFAPLGTIGRLFMKIEQDGFEMV